ncbi:unnamed protein product [Nezara viridula]|uniref:Uncharacterized protein n=1 Tax=Nezara viridula TaxID=85310 RepID=A0A9P0E5T4_NEZVI|nr:unnamed protein product [Nezara viridula]
MAESNEENTTVKTDSEERSLSENEAPEEANAIHKDWAKKYYQMTVGSMFGEELVSILVDHMKADENDMIDVEGIMAPFSVEHWPRKILSGVVDLLENSGTLQSDYKKMLSKVLNIKKEEVELLSSDSIQKAVKFIKDQLKTRPSDEDVSRSDLQMAFESKCHLLDGCDIEPEDEQAQLVPEEEAETTS